MASSSVGSSPAPPSHSRFSSASFIQTLAEGARAQAIWSSSRACVLSRRSPTRAWRRSARRPRCRGWRTSRGRVPGPPRVQSPRRHSSLAHMIQSTSAFGQHVAACRSSAVGPRRAVLVRCRRGPYVWSWRCQQLADPVSVGESSQLHGRPRPPLAPAVSWRFDQRAAKHHSPNMIATASGTGALVVITFMKAAVLDVGESPKLDRSNLQISPGAILPV